MVYSSLRNLAWRTTATDIRATKPIKSPMTTALAETPFSSSFPGRTVFTI